MLPRKPKRQPQQQQNPEPKHLAQKGQDNSGWVAARAIPKHRSHRSPAVWGLQASPRPKHVVHLPRLLQSLGWGKNTFCLLRAPRIIKVWAGRDLQISSSPSAAVSIPAHLHPRSSSSLLSLHRQQDCCTLACRGSQDSSSFHDLGAIAGEQREDLATQTHAGWEQRAPRKLLCLCPPYFCSSLSPGAARKDMNSSFSTFWPGFACLQLLPARQKGRK